MAISSAPPPEWPPAGSLEFEVKLDDLINEWWDKIPLHGLLWALELHVEGILAALQSDEKPNLSIVPRDPTGR